MDDQQGSQNPTNYTQIRPATPSAFLQHLPQQQHYEMNQHQQSKKQMFHTQPHLPQQWVRNPSPSMVMPQNYQLASSQQFVNMHQTTSPEGQFIQHSPLIQQLGSTSISSPQTCSEQQPQQIAQKSAHFIQPSKLQNYPSHPQPPQVRQRLPVELLPSPSTGQTPQQYIVSRNGSHCIQEHSAPTHTPVQLCQESERSTINVNMHNPQQQPYIQGLAGHLIPIGVPVAQQMRMSQTSSLTTIPSVTPTPVSLSQQRISVYHQNLLMSDQMQMQSSVPSTVHPSAYVGSQRFAMPLIGDIDSQNSPKHKYRDLKKKFKYLVYENEYYQEELRNLQRKLLKLSRDKNFLLDRLGQYENVSESEDSDSSVKTLEDQGTQKIQKRKQKQASNRKKALNGTVTNQNSKRPTTIGMKATKKKETDAGKNSRQDNENSTITNKELNNGSRIDAEDLQKNDLDPIMQEEWRDLNELTDSENPKTEN